MQKPKGSEYEELQSNSALKYTPVEAARAPETSTSKEEALPGTAICAPDAKLPSAATLT